MKQRHFMPQNTQKKVLWAFGQESIHGPAVVSSRATYSIGKQIFGPQAFELYIILNNKDHQRYLLIKNWRNSTTHLVKYAQMFVPSQDLSSPFIEEIEYIGYLIVTIHTHYRKLSHD